MQLKREVVTLKKVDEKTNIEIPHLKEVGIGTKFLIFVEIARHPNGLSVPDLTKKVSSKSRTIWFHTKDLCDKKIITPAYEKNPETGKVETVFRATPFGIGEIQREMRGICEIMSAIKMEMISNVRNAKDR